MASTQDFKNGLCLNFNNDIYQIVEFQHVKPGKGAAFVRTKLKSLTNGRVLDNTFNAGVKVESVRVENRAHQYLYKEDSGFCFMDTNNYEQISINKDIISNGNLLKEGQTASILFESETEKPLTCELPQYIVLEIAYTEPGIKGDTATNTLKPAKTETDAEIMVPLFVNIGDKIKIDTRDASYVERANS